MTRAGRRFQAALAMAWYLAVGFGLPLVDSLVYHDQESPRFAHVESSDTECHRGECSLDAPGAPHSPAGQPVDAPRVVAVPRSTVASVPPETPRSRSPGRAHAPRAPPQFD